MRELNKVELKIRSEQGNFDFSDIRKFTDSENYDCPGETGKY